MKIDKSEKMIYTIIGIAVCVVIVGSIIAFTLFSNLK